MATQIENERRFLVEQIPGVAAWPVSFVVSKIKQVYLANTEGNVERVRSRSWRDGRRELTHNTKVNLGPGSNRETEDAITDRTFNEFLKRADPDRQPLIKARMVFEHSGMIWELDEIFACGLNILEVELPNISDEVDLPPWLNIIREITDDPSYSNYALSLTPPG